MSKQETYISFIIDQLQSGNVERGKVLAIFGKKWQKGVRSFDRYWKEANELYLEAQNKLQKEKESIYIESEKKAFKTALKTKTERMAELQAMLEPDYLTSEIVGISNGVPVWADRPLTPMERKHIHSELSKMDGSYAPTKVATTDTDGKDRPIIDLSKYDDSELRLLIDLQRKGGVSEA